MVTDPDTIRLQILKGEMKYLDKKQIEQLEKQKKEESIKKLVQCYEEILDFLDSWVDIPKEYKKVISIWVIGTYFHKNFNTYPYLFFNAMRGSGKTRLLRIISWLQSKGNGEILNNPSDAVMFRTAQERGLIFDEFESERSKDKQTMREYLNACYKQGGVVYRMEKQKDALGKERQVAVGHTLYTPVALANINGIEDVLGDRSISLILEKSMNPYLVKKIEDFQTNQKLKEIKANLTQVSVELCNVELLKKVISGWNVYIEDKYSHLSTSLHTIHTIHNTTQLYTEEEREIYNKIDEINIFGRNLELFFPLLVTARLMGKEIFIELIEISRNLNKVKKDDEFAESKDVTLIEFVSLADRHRFNYTYTHDLFREFKEFLGSAGEEEDRWLSVQWFGLALKRLKLIGDRKRVAKGIMVLLDVDKAKERIKVFKSNGEEVKEEYSIKTREGGE